jgi:hypothetical protein
MLIAACVNPALLLRCFARTSWEKRARAPDDENSAVDISTCTPPSALAHRAGMDLEQLLEENKEWLERDAAASVVRCRLSGHTMPLRADAITQYMRRVCTQ